MKRKITAIFFMIALFPVLFGAAMDTDSTDSYEDNDYTYVISEVLNVILPSAVEFNIDPFELGGRGQIYSDMYFIENKSETSVFLTFSDGGGVTFANNTDFEAVSYPFGNIKSDLKSIYLVLNFGRDDIPDIVFTDYNHSGGVTIELEPHSLIPFSFSGTVNPYPAVKWRAGDVKLCLTYALTYDEDIDEPKELEEPEEEAEEFEEETFDGLPDEDEIETEETTENIEIPDQSGETDKIQELEETDEPEEDLDSESYDETDETTEIEDIDESTEDIETERNEEDNGELN